MVDSWIYEDQSCNLSRCKVLKNLGLNGYISCQSRSGFPHNSPNYAHGTYVMEQYFKL